MMFTTMDALATNMRLGQAREREHLRSVLRQLGYDADTVADWLADRRDFDETVLAQLLHEIEQVASTGGRVTVH